MAILYTISNGGNNGGGGSGGAADAYKTVKVGNVNIVANGEDTIELIQGQNVILTPNPTTKTLTISATINTDSDYVFLLSEIEIFGSTTYSFSGEGSQYCWYAAATENRYKLPGWNTSFSDNGDWWERSPTSGYSSYFCRVYRDGSASDDVASSTLGLAPAFCL